MAPNVVCTYLGISHTYVWSQPSSLIHPPGRDSTQSQRVSFMFQDR